jgi:hypothetical protein
MLEQQGEAAARPRPWHGDGLDAAGVAADARHTGGQIGLVLKEVEVPPGLPFGVVGWAARRIAGGTVEAASGDEVDLDVEPARLGVEVGAADRPGWG